MLVTEQRLEKALRIIAETDNEYAEHKGAVLRAEYMAECAESLAYKQLQGTVEDRKREVKLVPEVKTAWENYFQVTVNFERCKAFRARELLVIDVYRTQEASRRAGHI
jgi:predicted metal-dependent hydrolase